MKKYLPFIILGVGSLQILGHLTGSKTLRGLGLASGIAPYPKVFCEAKGYEPFAARFSLIGENKSGATQVIALDAERYSRLTGPYMRRNVYGATLAYAPRLPESLRQHLFGELTPLLSELGLSDLKNPRILITARESEEVSSYEYPLEANSKP